MNYFRDFFHILSGLKMWHALFHNFIWLDWVLFSSCLAATFAGALRGFGFFLGKLISILILIYSVMLTYPVLSEWSVQHLTFAKAAFWNPFFFALITGLVVTVAKKFSKLQSKKSLPQFHPFWDRVVGAAAGFFYMLLVVSFISQFLLLLPIKKMHAAYARGGSRHGQLTKDFVPQLVDYSLLPVRALLNSKVPRL